MRGGSDDIPVQLALVLAVSVKPPVARLLWLSMPKGQTHIGQAVYYAALMRNATSFSPAIANPGTGWDNKTKCRSSLDLAFKLPFSLYCTPVFLLHLA